MLAAPRLIIPPTREILTVEEALDLIGVDAGIADNAFASWIAGARSYVETQTRRVLRESTYEFAFDGFPALREPMALDIAPVIAVESVRYLDRHGEYAEFEDFIADLDNDPVRVGLLPRACWPSVCPGLAAVLVTVIAGYEETSAGYDLPDGLKQAVISQVRSWWNPRTASQNDGALEPDKVIVDALIEPYRRCWIVPASLPNRP